jgi:cysteine synthase A
MPHWFEDNATSIGRTPLVRLNRIHDDAPSTILAKIEGRNPGYSVKCRLGAAMVWDAEKRGVLGPGKELVERRAAIPASRSPSSRPRAATRSR